MSADAFPALGASAGPLTKKQAIAFARAVNLTAADVPGFAATRREHETGAERRGAAPGTTGSFAWRIELRFTLHGIQVPLYLDILGFVYGQAQVSLFSTGQTAGNCRWLWASC
jgi:hypothetical protein